MVRAAGAQLLDSQDEKTTPYGNLAGIPGNGSPPLRLIFQYVSLGVSRMYRARNGVPRTRQPSRTERASRVGSLWCPFHVSGDIGRMVGGVAQLVSAADSGSHSVGLGVVQLWRVRGLARGESWSASSGAAASSSRTELVPGVGDDQGADRTRPARPASRTYGALGTVTLGLTGSAS
jgi:hypothetical protein